MQVTYTDFFLNLGKHIQWKLLPESYTCIFSACWTAYMVGCWSGFKYLVSKQKLLCPSNSHTKKSTKLQSPASGKTSLLTVCFVLFNKLHNNLDALFFKRIHYDWWKGYLCFITVSMPQRQDTHTHTHTLHQRATKAQFGDIIRLFICEQVNSQDAFG